MTSQSFCYWLQGFFEVSGATQINEIQTQQIKNHLNLGFKHEIDPSIDGNKLDVKQELGEIHNHNLPLHNSNGWPEGTILRC